MRGMSHGSETTRILSPSGGTVVSSGRTDLSDLLKTFKKIVLTFSYGWDFFMDAVPQYLVKALSFEEWSLAHVPYLLKLGHPMEQRHLLFFLSW